MRRNISGALAGRIQSDDTYGNENLTLKEHELGVPIAQINVERHRVVMSDDYDRGILRSGEYQVSLTRFIESTSSVCLSC